MVNIVPITTNHVIFSLRKIIDSGVAINGADAVIAAVVDAKEYCKAIR